MEPAPISLPGKFHGQRSLAGYSPRGRKESDTTENLPLYLEAHWPHALPLVQTPELSELSISFTFFVVAVFLLLK